MKSAVVTGVSTGIGHAIAVVLIAAGWQVFGSVRTAAAAARLQAELGAALVPLIFDVEDDEAVAAAADAVRTLLGKRTLDGLVNNAGVALSDPLLIQSVADFRRQIAVNLTGVFAVTRAFARCSAPMRSRLDRGAASSTSVRSAGGSVRRSSAPMSRRSTVSKAFPKACAASYGWSALTSSSSRPARSRRRSGTRPKPLRRRIWLGPSGSDRQPPSPPMRCARGAGGCRPSPLGGSC